MEECIFTKLCGEVTSPKESQIFIIESKTLYSRRIVQMFKYNTDPHAQAKLYN